MKKISELAKAEKKQLFGRLLLAKFGKKNLKDLPRGAWIQELASRCETDTTTVWRWPREGKSWVRRRVEPTVWEYFSLTSESTNEEAERKIAELNQEEYVPFRSFATTEERISIQEEAEEYGERAKRLMRKSEKISDHLKRQINLLEELDSLASKRAASAD